MLWVRLIRPDGWLITLGETREMKEILEILHDIGWFTVVLFVALVAIYAVLIAAGILAHWFSDIFMFGWHLL
jgi:hypothetical protein